jgi:hypothetical protein
MCVDVLLRLVLLLLLLWLAVEERSGASGDGGEGTQKEERRWGARRVGTRGSNGGGEWEEAPDAADGMKGAWKATNERNKE